MIAKFHSAPGHSMETTLTISLPPVQSVKASRADREREREREQEWEMEQIREREKRVKKEKKKEEQEKRKMELEKKKMERQMKKQEVEREKEMARMRHMELENEKRLQRERDLHDRAMRLQYPDRVVSYKDKFQRMREKYDKATNAHETSQRELDTLNAKMKKLQSENDLLLDALLSSETVLYDRYFGSIYGPSDDPDDYRMPMPSFTSLTPSQAPASHPDPGSSASGATAMPPPTSASSVSTVAPPTTSSSGGYRSMPPPHSPNPPPTSASSNATGSTVPPSSATSSTSNTNRRVHPSGRSEEMGVNGDARRTPPRPPSPMAVEGAESSRGGEENDISKTPRINGTTSSVISTSTTSNEDGLGRQEGASRETTPQPLRLRDDDVGMENDTENVDDDEGPAPPGPDAGAGVHSPMEREDDEDDEEEVENVHEGGERMDVDDEGAEEVQSGSGSASVTAVSPRASGIGSLRGGGRGHP